jgi:hypothetical protein
MGTGRTFNKQSRTRPKKKPRERRRREKNQRERLVALGVSEDAIKHMTSQDVRQALQRPGKVAAS